MRDFSFKYEVALMNQRHLEALGEVVDGGRTQRRARQNEREDGRRRIARRIGGIAGAQRRRTGCRDGSDNLTLAGDAGIDQRLNDRRAVDASIINSVAATETRLAITVDVKRKSQARTKVVLVTGPVGSLRQGRIN